jgi:hypothetical protein
MLIENRMFTPYVQAALNDDRQALLHHAAKPKLPCAVVCFTHPDICSEDQPSARPMRIDDAHLADVLEFAGITS